MITMKRHTVMLPPPPAPPEEIRYDLDSSDFERLDLDSAQGLITLAAKWQARNSAARVARILSDRSSFFS